MWLGVRAFLRDRFSSARRNLLLIKPALSPQTASVELLIRDVIRDWVWDILLSKYLGFYALQTISYNFCKPSFQSTPSTQERTNRTKKSPPPPLPENKSSFITSECRYVKHITSIINSRKKKSHF